MDDFSPMADPSATGRYPDGGTRPANYPMGADGQGMDGMGMDDGLQPDPALDPGVDADEDSDPKRYIQHLCGKLSQSLRKYNGGLPRPDEELCKYVAGMILKQTTDGLTDDDKKDIIDKVNREGDGGNDDTGEGGDKDMSPMDGQQPMTERTNHGKLVNEIFQELMKKDDGKYNN